MALGKLIALSENYPNLKASDNVKTLMEELSAPRIKSPSRVSFITTW